jgi:hypothetical protein
VFSTTIEADAVALGHRPVYDDNEGYDTDESDDRRDEGKHDDSDDSDVDHDEIVCEDVTETSSPISDLKSLVKRWIDLRVRAKRFREVEDSDKLKRGMKAKVIWAVVAELKTNEGRDCLKDLLGSQMNDDIDEVASNLMREVLMRFLGVQEKSNLRIRIRVFVTDTTLNCAPRAPRVSSECV